MADNKYLSKLADISQKKLHSNSFSSLSLRVLSFNFMVQHLGLITSHQNSVGGTLLFIYILLYLQVPQNTDCIYFRAKLKLVNALKDEQLA